MSFQPHRALSPDDSGRVTAMAATLPLDQNLADEPGLILALHHRRFLAADIALLAPYVAAKARELRAALGLDDPREAVAGLFFFLAMASATFFFCFIAPGQAEAHAALAVAPREAYGPFDWLFATASVLIWTIAVPYSLWQVVVALSALATHRDLREPLAPLAPPRIDEEIFWTTPQWETFDARCADLRRHAWHIYIAMAMSGDLDCAPPRRMTVDQVRDAFVYAARRERAPTILTEGPETASTVAALTMAA